MTEYAIAEIRRIIAALSPAVLEQLGLAAALRQLGKRVRGVYSGKLQLHLPPKFGPFPKEIEIAVFRLVQECFQNITKHAEASTVNVSLDSTDKTLRLTVADDGVGFDVSAAADRPNSFGLAGMRERVTLLGGRFDIQSGRHRGTRITVELPVSSRQKKGSAGKAATMQHA
jgi:two-component system sensor histidine kinase DegS